MKEFPKEAYCCGSKKNLIEPRKFLSGPLDISFESGLVRNIRIGEYEVIRMIYFALRDHNWDTIIPVIRNEKIKESDKGFNISYESHFDEKDIRFVFYSKISGNTSGQVVFEIRGKALSGFRTNRTGFCVLHPVDECQGRQCEITDPAGNRETFTFPEIISPHQPMKNIAEMSWALDGIGKAHLKFEGDVFEMEDQRNWTDDSYKTYCRPLDLPFPYELKRGEQIHQKITLSVSTDHKIDQPVSRPFQLKCNTQMHYPLPDLGIAQSQSRPVLSENELALIERVNFDFYEINITFDLDWEKKVLVAVSESNRLELSLSLKIHFTGDYKNEINGLERIFKNQSEIVRSVSILHQKLPVVSDDFIDRVLRPLKELFPSTKIGAGTIGFFAELNRNRILNRDLDFLSFAVTPQVHAFDNLTLIENLKGQASVVESAHDFAFGKEIHISPVTFRMQSNPAATSEGTEPVRGMPHEIDPRQMSLFGAGWTLGSIKKLTEAGAGAITYYETVGEKGIIQGDQDPVFPDKFPVRENAVYPVYYILKKILGAKESQMVQSISSHPTLFEGMVLMSEKIKTIILANYADHQIEVRIDNLKGSYRMIGLSDDNVAKAMYNPEDYDSVPDKNISYETSSALVVLKPFGISIIRELK